MSKCFNKDCAYCKDYVCTFNDGKNIEECCWYEKEIKTSSVSDIVNLFNREMDGLLDEYAKRRVAELEAKLAESEEFTQGYRKECAKIQSENVELKQKLAEKDEELKREKENTEMWFSWKEKYYNELQQIKQQLTEKEKEIETLTKLKAKEMGKSLYGIVGSLEKITNESVNMAKSHQDKISFAVEQLEKVKEFVIRQLFITTKGCSDLDEAEAKGCNELREETIKEIDNQINVLRNNKDGIH